MEFSIWLSGVGRTSCDVCKNAYEGTDKIPPCDTCKPELKKVNVPFFVLHSYCADQYILGAGGAVTLNMLAINQAMIDYHIDEDERILFSTKVRRIAQIILAEQHEEAEAKRKRK